MGACVCGRISAKFYLNARWPKAISDAICLFLLKIENILSRAVVASFRTNSFTFEIPDVQLISKSF